MRKKGTKTRSQRRAEYFPLKKSIRKGDAAMIMAGSVTSFCDFEKDLCLKQEFSTYKYQLIIIYKKEYIQICKQAGFQENFTKNYLLYFLTFLKHLKFAHPLTIKNEEIRNFLIQLNKKDYSKNTIN